MRIPRILSFYILREVLLYAGLGLLVVGSLMLTQNMLQRLDDMAAVGFQAPDVLAVLICLVGTLLGYVIPIAFLFGVLVAVGRMSADSEVTAMRALGISFGQLAVPSLLLALLTSALTGVLLSEVEPLARRQLGVIFSEIASRGGIIQPGHFNRLDHGEQRLLFVEERDEQNRLGGVLVMDRSDPTQPFVVVAERGRFSFESETNTAHLQLENGDIHFESEEGSEDRYRRIGFADLDYAFDMSEVLDAGPSRFVPKKMNTQRIVEVLDYFESHGGWAPSDVRVKEKESYEIQLHRRLALPFAPLLFALVGIPLGLRRSHGARSWGALICVGLVFLYYALLSFGSFLAEDRAVPASVALWLPNAVFAALAVPLLYRARSAEI